MPVPDAPVTPTQPRATLPGFNPPPPGAATMAGGTVRAVPAHMPFYVATRGTTTIYLLGTLHVGDPADYPPPNPSANRSLAALAASPTLALELSPDDLLVSQDDVSKYGVCARPCLPRLLPPALWRRLAYRLRDNPTHSIEIRKMRPWLASLLVENLRFAERRTSRPNTAPRRNCRTLTCARAARSSDWRQWASRLRAFTGLTLAAAARNAGAGSGA